MFIYVQNDDGKTSSYIDDYSKTITYLFFNHFWKHPRGRNSDIFIENENKKYIIDINVAFDCQENISTANSRKIEKYCEIGFVIP